MRQELTLEERLVREAETLHRMLENVESVSLVNLEARLSIMLALVEALEKYGGKR